VPVCSIELQGVARSNREGGDPKSTYRSADKAMASSSSRLCSDEELQKAREDLNELCARRPITDEDGRRVRVSKASFNGFIRIL
jgi:hypothetical protein